MLTRKYYHHIAGLKGISCIFIMIGHFIQIYKNAQSFQLSSPMFDAILSSKFSFLISAEYWLYLFIIISGYLVAKSKINTIKDVVIKSITRFFRFALPILFAYLVIYLIYILLGFHNCETINLFKCDWYQSYYLDQYSIKDVLIGPINVLFLGDCVLNAPYWVLRLMFFTSILIYILKYLYMRFSKKNENICFTLMVIITILSTFVSPVITTCLLGMLISICEDTELVKKSYFVFWFLVITMLLYVASPIYISSIFFGSLIIFAPKVKLINDFLSSKFIGFLEKISWGVYSFHWALMCSAGAIFIIALQSKLSLFTSYILACILVVFITLIVSIIYNYTFERLSSFLLSKIDICVKQIFHKRF